MTSKYGCGKQHEPVYWWNHFMEALGFTLPPLQDEETDQIKMDCLDHPAAKDVVSFRQTKVVADTIECTIPNGAPSDG